LQKRKLGRTGLQVSIAGFGGTYISQISMDEAVKVVQGAIEFNFWRS
jgi:aryl-alcohol dehydrogenase-like predicted oxidoreductase